MNFEGLEYRNGILHFSDVSLEEIAGTFSTPLYVYSEKVLSDRIQSYLDGAGNYPIEIFYSVKANSNLSILKIIRDHGLGADIVSGGELYRCLKVHFPGKKIIFSGAGKSEEEIYYALKEKILFLNVESREEIEKINEIAAEMQITAPIGIRINPGIDPKTHPYIATGLKENKFGIASEEFEEVLQFAQKKKNIEVVGFGYHIGSQITGMESQLDALKKTHALIKIFQGYGKLRFLDLGGGLGIRYNKENPPAPKEYVEKLAIHIPWEELRDTVIILEPGRSIAGPSGIFLTRILYVKKNYDKIFYIVDGGMNDLIRPTLYSAYHTILPLRYSGSPKIHADVVGPVCETGDFFARNRELPLLEKGEYLAILSAGAYGFVMSSQYNSRPRAAEILLLKDGRAKVIRERESYEDLIRKEIAYL